MLEKTGCRYPANRPQTKQVSRSEKGIETSKHRWGTQKNIGPLFLPEEQGCCLLQASIIRHSSEFHRVIEGTTDLMLVDLSRKVVHRELLSAFTSSSSFFFLI